MLAAGLLAGCAGPGSQKATGTIADGPQALILLNAYRASVGAGPVRLDAALSEAALRQALAIAEANTLSHEVAGPLRRRLEAVAVRDVVAAENIGRGTPDASRALLSWQHSPSHDQNLKLATATRIGFARADAPGGPWWVLILAGDQREGYRWSVF